MKSKMTMLQEGALKSLSVFAVVSALMMVFSVASAQAFRIGVKAVDVNGNSLDKNVTVVFANANNNSDVSVNLNGGSTSVLQWSTTTVEYPNVSVRYDGNLVNAFPLLPFNTLKYKYNTVVDVDSGARIGEATKDNLIASTDAILTIRFNIGQVVVPSWRFGVKSEDGFSQALTGNAQVEFIDSQTNQIIATQTLPTGVTAGGDNLTWVEMPVPSHSQLPRVRTLYGGVQKGEFNLVRDQNIKFQYRYVIDAIGGTKLAQTNPSIAANEAILVFRYDRVDVILHAENATNGNLSGTSKIKVENVEYELPNDRTSSINVEMPLGDVPVEFLYGTTSVGSGLLTVGKFDKKTVSASNPAEVIGSIKTDPAEITVRFPYVDVALSTKDYEGLGLSAVPSIVFNGQSVTLSQNPATSVVAEMPVGNVSVAVFYGSTQVGTGLLNIQLLATKVVAGADPSDEISVTGGGTQVAFQYPYVDTKLSAEDYYSSDLSAAASIEVAGQTIVLPNKSAGPVTVELPAGAVAVTVKFDDKNFGSGTFEVKPLFKKTVSGKNPAALYGSPTNEGAGKTEVIFRYERADVALKAIDFSNARLVRELSVLFPDESTEEIIVNPSSGVNPVVELPLGFVNAKLYLENQILNTKFDEQHEMIDDGTLSLEVKALYENTVNVIGGAPISSLGKGISGSALTFRYPETLLQLRAVDLLKNPLPSGGAEPVTVQIRIVGVNNNDFIEIENNTSVPVEFTEVIDGLPAATLMIDAKVNGVPVNDSTYPVTVKLTKSRLVEGINGFPPIEDIFSEGGTRLTFRFDVNYQPTAVAGLDQALECKPLTRYFMIDQRTPGWYNNVGNVLEQSGQFEFPVRDAITPFYETYDPAKEPNWSPAASDLGAWFSNPASLATDGNWTRFTGYPALNHNSAVWDIAQEIAVVYPIDAGTSGLYNLEANIVADNGVSVWIDGQFKYGSLSTAHINGDNFRHSVRLGSLSPGIHWLQILISDHGAVHEFALDLTGTYTEAGSDVVLDGSSSVDPNKPNVPGAGLTYTWYENYGHENQRVVAGPTSNPTSQVQLPSEDMVVTLLVNDGRGGTDTDEITVSITDTTPPQPVIGSPIAGNYFNVWTGEVIGTINENCSVESVQATTPAGTTDGSWIKWSPTFPYSFDDVALVEGQNTITVNVADKANNTGAAEVVVFLDTTPPVIQNLYPANKPTVEDEDVNLTGKVFDVGIGVAPTIAIVVKDSEGLIVVTNEAVTLAEDGTFSLSVTGLADGNYSIEITTADKLGNSEVSTSTFQVQANQPPVANAGLDQTIEATGPLTTVTLAGSGSDVDGDELVFSWTWANEGSAQGATPQVVLPVGTHTLTLTVSDGLLSATGDVVINVVDTTAPTIVELTDAVSVACTNETGETVTLSARAEDLVTLAGNLTYRWYQGENLIGQTAAIEVIVVGMVDISFQVVIVDEAGNTVTGTAIVSFQDVTPPTINAALIPTIKGNDQNGDGNGSNGNSGHSNDNNGDGNGNNGKGSKKGYLVSLSITDNCDPNPTLLAYIPQPILPGDSYSVDFKSSSKKKEIKIVYQPGDIKVKIYGSDQSSMVALLNQAIAQGGFTVQNGDFLELKLTNSDNGDDDNGDNDDDDNGNNDDDNDHGDDDDNGNNDDDDNGNNGNNGNNDDDDDNGSGNGNNGKSNVSNDQNGSGNGNNGKSNVSNDQNSGSSKSTTSDKDKKAKEEAEKKAKEEAEKKAKEEAAKKAKEEADKNKNKKKAGKTVVAGGYGTYIYTFEEKNGGYVLVSVNAPDVTMVAKGQDASGNTASVTVVPPPFPASKPVLTKPVVIADKPVSSYEFGLEQNFPNPFNPSTTIRYTLSEDTDVRLVIYNILGQEVRVLVDAVKTAGVHDLAWDGKDALGHQMATGIYIYHLRAGSKTALKKMLFTK